MPDIRHYAIPSRLQAFIERAMTLDFTHSVGATWHVVPTGCFGIGTLVGNLPGADERFISDSPECTFTGVLPHAVGTWCDRPVVSMGVTLTPLAASMLPLDAHDFDESSFLPAERLIGGSVVTRLRGQVLDAATLDDKMQAYLAWVEALLFDRRPPHGRRAAIAEAAMRMRAPDGPNVEEAALRVGVRRRQFERDFRRYLGTTPKRYAMAAKVQQMAQLAWQGHGLADIAAALRYADQAHMTHAIRDITGSSPGAFLQRASVSAFARATRPFWDGRISNL